MNWPWFYRDHSLPPAGRGRPGPRLVRGLLWALVAVFIISVLVLAAVQCIPDPVVRTLSG